MLITDIGKRVHDHTWKHDPIVRSLFDTDFYKLLMLQMIWRLHKDVRVTFTLINRASDVRLADEIDERELRAQLDHARSLRFGKKELIWLAGNTFYGQSRIFAPEFIEFLAGFALPPYELSQRDGQFHLEFAGPWTHTTLWEIPALAIVNELRSRAALKRSGRLAIDVVYARAKAKLWDKLERLRGLPDLRISDFGTRRRHSFLWQRWAVEAMKEALGSAFIGTSNVLLAMDSDLEAIGTNGHELPMVAAALAEDDASLKDAPFRVLRDWQQLYKGNLLILLPDTFGTTSFLRNAPDWAADWTGIRPDSGPPLQAGEQVLQWWRAKGRDPGEKLLILSDALDVATIEQAYARFHGKIRLSFGWGTNLSNDFAGCAVAPDVDRGLRAISLVCKVTSVNGRPAVKLSDNPAKSSGPPEEVERYLRAFGSEGMVALPVLV